MLFFRVLVMVLVVAALVLGGFSIYQMRDQPHSFVAAFGILSVACILIMTACWWWRDTVDNY